MLKTGLILCAVLLAGCSAAGAPPMTPHVTIWWTPQPTASSVRSAAANTPVPTAIPASPTPPATDYTVVPGDTLWDIAVKFRLTVDEMTAANPDINPDLLHPGDVIKIPSAGDLAQHSKNAAANPLAEARPAGTPGMVAADAGGLRLREAPDTASNILKKLAALTPVTILKHSADNAWLEVQLADGNRGWVMAQYVDTAASAASAQKIDARPGAGAPISAQSILQNAPYLTDFTTRARDIYKAGQARGNHSNVFAVIGDSNSASPLYLEPFDTGNYNLGAYGYLRDTINYFKGSFYFSTVAAVVGIDTTRLMDPARADPAKCLPGESLLACEYRRKKPSVALILIGTNDTGNWQNFEADFRPIVEATISRGIVPVLMTKGDDLESTKYHAPPGYINDIIIRVSREYGVPLLDLHAVTTKLPDGGFGKDGFHFNVPPDSQTANFTGFHLNYGYTIRNLTALQALDAVRRLIIQN